MVNKIAKITIYVNNQDEAVNFWVEKMKFRKVFDQEIGSGIRWIEVAFSQDYETNIILYSKDTMKHVDPTMLAHPAMMFGTNDIEKTYQELKDNNVKVDGMIQMPYGMVFPFYDQDGNTFLVTENK